MPFLFLQLQFINRVQKAIQLLQQLFINVQLLGYLFLPFGHPLFLTSFDPEADLASLFSSFNFACTGLVVVSLTVSIAFHKFSYTYDLRIFLIAEIENQ